MKSLLCNSFTQEREITKRRRVYHLIGRTILLTSEKDLFSKFHYAMTCCVAINAKEGDCWIQLINCMVVFDVTQMSYQSSGRVYRA